MKTKKIIDQICDELDRLTPPNEYGLQAHTAPGDGDMVRVEHIDGALPASEVLEALRELPDGAGAERIHLALAWRVG